MQPWSLQGALLHATLQLLLSPKGKEKYPMLGKQS